MIVLYRDFIEPQVTVTGKVLSDQSHGRAIDRLVFPQLGADGFWQGYLLALRSGPQHELLGIREGPGETASEFQDGAPIWCESEQSVLAIVLFTRNPPGPLSRILFRHSSHPFRFQILNNRSIAVW